MIDKNKYTSFIPWDDTREFVIKNMSKIESALSNHNVKKTDFMNPYEQSLFVSILNAFSNDVSYLCMGASQDCERKLFVVYPSYYHYDDCPLKLIRLYGNFKFEKISHRDCLGAIMSCGISREKFGDIYLNDNFVDVVVDEDIATYIAMNVSSIKHTGVKAKVIDIADISITYPNLVVKDYSVSSPRLDSIIASVLNLSRANSVSLIKSVAVKINYEPIILPSKEVFENSIISVKGYGRFKVLSYNGYSKKGKLRISVAGYK